MAATNESIWFDYQQAMSQAGALDEIAGVVERVAMTEVEDGLSIVSASWKGDNARRYQTKGERLQEQIMATARSLRKAAEEIREAAERVRRMELANLALVEERTYNC